MATVAVVRLPAGEPADLPEVRAFVLESLALGVLPLGKGVELELLDVPPLGGVLVEGRGQPPSGTAQPPPAPEPPGDEAGPEFTGHGAREKRRVHGALLAYRRRHGLGCLEELAGIIGGGMTAGILRSALARDKLPMEQWRQIGQALVRLEEAEAGREGP